MKRIVILTAALLATPGLNTIAAEADLIETMEQLRSLAENAIVVSVDVELPQEKEEMERAIWTPFARKSEVRAFSRVTIASWEAKWDLMSGILVDKANEQGLPGLREALACLNHGRQRLVPLPIIVNHLGPGEQPPPSSKPASERWIPFGASPEEAKRIINEAREEDERRLEEAMKQPPVFADPPDATIPVAAFLCRYGSERCWVIVCKWEVGYTKSAHASMAHTHVSAVIPDGCRIVGFVSCD